MRMKMKENHITFFLQKWLPHDKRVPHNQLVGKSLREFLPFVFRERRLDEFQKGKEFVLGDAFKTDGVQIHFTVVNKSSVDAKANKLNNFKKAGILRKEAKERGKQYVAAAHETQKADELKTNPIETPHPPKNIIPSVTLDEILVSMDPGVHNIGGFCCKTNMTKPYTITTKQYYQESGVYRNRDLSNKHRKKEMEDNAEFKNSLNAVENVSTKTTDMPTLLKALQIRSANFENLYKFFGCEKSARVNFLNRKGKDSFLDKLVNKVLPTKKHVLVCGDGYTNGGHNMKGKPAGASDKFVRKCKERGRRVIYADEHRSSMLCSVMRREMYNPPKKMMLIKSSHDKENPKPAKYYCQRIIGLYQSSIPGRSILWNRDTNAARNILINFLAKIKNGEVL